MGTAPPLLGEPLADSEIVFRAFSKDGFRRRPRKVRPLAYLRALDHSDGISLGRTPMDAVAGLETNYGYCSLSVGAIRALPYGLEVRPYLDDPNHLVICGVPYFFSEDRERGLAQEIAGALARISTLETCDQYPPKRTDQAIPEP